MRTRDGRGKVPFRTNYPMICHEPAPADLDALALDDAAPHLSANVQRLFEGGPRRPLASASGSEPDDGSGARKGRGATARRAVRRTTPSVTEQQSRRSSGRCS
jgi:hypothetical protein